MDKEIQNSAGNGDARSGAALAGEPVAEGMQAGIQPLGKGRLSARFRRLNMLLFAIAFCIIAMVMMGLLNGFIAKSSIEFAEVYALSSAEALSAHISRELGIMSSLAKSDAITDWMTDEGNEEKKVRAFSEMANIVGNLYSFNLYIGLKSSSNQYMIDTGYAPANISQVDVMDINDQNDAWYFDCINSDKEYILNVGIDQFMQRKRVWLNYKVTHDGETIGVLSTGLEFSHVAGELFSQYSVYDMRGLIIDENGITLMDSMLMKDKDFLYSDFESRIEEEYKDTRFLTALRSRLNDINGYQEDAGTPAVVRISSGPYRYVTIMPIRLTSWSTVILSGGQALFNISYFIPILATVLAMLLAVAIITGTANYRLIFLPLSRINKSMPALRESLNEQVYGLDRNDELGELAKTIQDLFTKANKDALTGIYNRRFMENNLDHIIGMLMRSSGTLSVLMMDIDFFKKYNDAYGHEEGDACLRSVALALASSVTRSSDFVARYGGEEFIAILTDTDEDGATLVAAKLLENVRALNIQHSGNAAAPCVTVSIGVTTGNVAFGQKWEEYVKRADEALYMSKENGRNRFTFKDMESVNE